MVSSSKIITTKNFLKTSLLEKDDIGKSLSRFIDNSIKARSSITTGEDSCKVDIKLFKNLIVISDNSRGFDENLSSEDIFKIGNYNGHEMSGLGIKKSFFSLGNKIDIISNKKACSKKFTIDFNLYDEELLLKSEVIDYKEDRTEGTDIYISDLEKNIEKEILDNFCVDKIINRLGRIYSKFLEKGELIIRVNGEIVKAKNIGLSKISTCNILNDYKVDLYKGSKGDVSGIDLFINNYLVYNRVKNKDVKWNLLNESKYSFRDCVVEITYYGDKTNFIEDKEKLLLEVINFIKEHKMHFLSKTITIQYEVPIEKVEQLQEYHGEKTAKAIGIKAFNKLYEDFLYYNKNNRVL